MSMKKIGFGSLPLFIAFMFLLSPFILFAEETSMPTLANCALAGRQPSADGIFRIPDTVRAVKSTFDVSCFVTLPQNFSGVTKAVTYKGDTSEIERTIGTLPVDLSSPASGMTIPATETLPPGKHQLVVRLEDKSGKISSYEYRLQIEVAQGENYAVPEISKAIEEKEMAAKQAASSQTPSKFGIKTMIVAVVIILLIISISLIIYRVWKRRNEGII